MVRINTVWERTTQVMQGRFGMLATIAGLLSFLPALVQGAYRSFVLLPGIAAGTVNPLSVGVVSSVITLASLLLAIWSGLALVAAASDPRIASAGEAMAVGVRRVPVAIGLSLLLGLVLVLVIVPVVGVIGASSGINVAALQAGRFADAVSPGLVLTLVVFVLALLAFFLWLAARLFLLNPVLINERRGLG
jgi:multisubunit Na+/H+ antiporter MnhC subunit